MLVGIIGYWSVITIQSGTEFEVNQKIQQLQEENEKLAEKTKELADKLDSTQSKLEDLNEPAPISTQPTVYKNQNLINELEKLIKDNVSMKLKSSGTRVGTVQNFLNIYNNTSNKVDNDYGAGTQKAVTAFQKDQGLTVDGEIGPSTFSKMIDWLKKQG